MSTLLKHCFYLFFFFLGSHIPVYSEYLFISSVPMGAKVSIVPVKQSKNIRQNTKRLGVTPLKLTNFSEPMKIIIEHNGYFTMTNEINPSTKIQNCVFNLAPLAFDVSFLNAPGAYFIANGKTYTDLDGVLALPYGQYNMTHDLKQNALSVQYKSPYTPYTAFFSTITVLSAIMAITGGVLGYYAYQDFLNSADSSQLVSNMKKVSTWETVTWASLGIGTGALIGSLTSGILEAKDKKRIKRFNELNKSGKELDYLSDFEEIVLLSALNTDNVFDKIDKFIKKYPDALLLPDVYIKRAGLYLLREKPRYDKAIADLKLVINKYPTKLNYELATKFLGDIYLARNNYDLSYQSFQETLKVLDSYSYSDVKIEQLEALYLWAGRDSSKKEQFLKESLDLKGFSKEQRNKISEWRLDMEKIPNKI